MKEFKAKIARHSTAMAKIFNAEIVRFTCSIADYGLLNTSLPSVDRSKEDYNYGLFTRESSMLVPKGKDDAG